MPKSHQAKQVAALRKLLEHLACGVSMYRTATTFPGYTASCDLAAVIPTLKAFIADGQFMVSMLKGLWKAAGWEAGSPQRGIFSYAGPGEHYEWALGKIAEHTVAKMSKTLKEFTVRGYHDVAALEGSDEEFSVKLSQFRALLHWLTRGPVVNPDELQLYLTRCSYTDATGSLHAISDLPPIVTEDGAIDQSALKQHTTLLHWMIANTFVDPDISRSVRTAVLNDAPPASTTPRVYLPAPVLAEPIAQPILIPSLSSPTAAPIAIASDPRQETQLVLLKAAARAAQKGIKQMIQAVEFVEAVADKFSGQSASPGSAQAATTGPNSAPAESAIAEAIQAIEVISGIFGLVASVQKPDTDNDQSSSAPEGANEETRSEDDVDADDNDDDDDDSSSSG